MGVSSMIPFITTYWPHGLALVAGFIIFRFMTTVYFEKRSSNGSLVRRDIDDVYEPMTEHEMNDTFGCDDFREKEGTMHFETTRYDEKDMIIRSKGFYLDVGRRRTVREFSDKPVPIEVIENIIKAAGQTNYYLILTFP
uniref:Iodotyrosine dehalogenase 1-like n=1 Tax=Saccoglossus kowalevskii TaxID=10224 RepID=A0ABM0MAZ8_SACKO|nr:PREDICTED: iodotyrosine dehalogenase 1-like [Saccoglossus kowalevskii]